MEEIRTNWPNGHNNNNNENDPSRFGSTGPNNAFIKERGSDCLMDGNYPQNERWIISCPLKKLPQFIGISSDSRKIKPGYAFVAISGFKQDGNNYIGEAIRRGASVIFTEKKIKENHKIPVIRVKDSRAALGYLSANFYNKPTQKIQLIGITGTNGKTTTTHLVYHLLNYRQPQKKAGLIGTVHVDIGNKKIPGNLTTPAPVKLQSYLNKMVKNGLSYACMEVSSHGIKLKRIAGCKFSIKVGTNISIDHFDLHPEYKDYINVKKSFLNTHDNELILLNKDDNQLSKITPADNTLFYSIKEKASIMASNIISNGYYTSFVYELKFPLKIKKGQPILPCKIPIKMHLPGEHNIYNALIAITIALYYGENPEKIKSFFLNFNGIWRRFQFIYQKDFTIIDDCAHNPGSYKAVFEAVQRMNFNKLLIINSLRGNRGIEINQHNAEVIGKWLLNFDNYYLLTSNCNDVVKEIDLVSEEEESAFLEILQGKNIAFKHYQELKPTLHDVLDLAGTGDLILLLGPHAMDHAAEMILELIKILNPGKKIR